MRPTRTLAALLAAVAVSAVLPAAGAHAAAPAKAKVQVAEIRTPWGYLRAREIRAPRGGACANIPLAFDVRNARSLPFGVDIQIADEFGNENGYVRVMTDMPDGVTQGNTIKVCGTDWTSTRLGYSSLIAYKGVKKGRYYLVVTQLGIGGTSELSTSYAFG